MNTIDEALVDRLTKAATRAVLDEIAAAGWVLVRRQNTGKGGEDDLVSQIHHHMVTHGEDDV